MSQRIAPRPKTATQSARYNVLAANGQTAPVQLHGLVSPLQHRDHLPGAQPNFVNRLEMLVPLLVPEAVDVCPFDLRDQGTHISSVWMIGTTMSVRIFGEAQKKAGHCLPAHLLWNAVPGDLLRGSATRHRIQPAPCMPCANQCSA